ncbi:MAG: hypothetical protein OEY06_02950 [Gammaproteobacteria bacterium]|nr:hypothetical protein [Gammaproteobacteria bacterium]
MKFNYSKILIALCAVLHLSGCGEDSSDSGTVTLDWAPPVERADGTAFLPSDIGGYRVYYGTTSGDYPNRLNIIDSTAQTATVTAVHGLYYYVITSFDTAGRESDFSLESSINI